MDEKNVEAVFLRTLLRKDVHERLEAYAKSLGNGFKKWDYGVAIERLLDSVMLNEQLLSLNERVTELESIAFYSEANNEVEQETKSNEESLIGNKHLTESKTK